MEENMKPRASISKYISRFLDESKMSKAAFGKLFGVTATSVTRWIECVCAPDIDLLPKISETLDVSIPELLGVGSEKPLSPSEAKVIKEYSSNMSFKQFVDLYMSDEHFRKSIDYIVSIMP